MSTNKAAYLMARLTVKGIRPGDSFGGIPELSKTDIAAACTRLQPLHFHLIMAKYCDDVHSAIQALGEIQEEMGHRAKVWAEMEPEKRTHCAAAMIDEFVSAKKCGKCKGLGEVKEGALVVTCKVCDGSGHRSPSVTSRARSCSIPESTFRSQRLNEPFQEMMRHLTDIEISALERISRKAS